MLTTYELSSVAAFTLDQATMKTTGATVHERKAAFTLRSTARRCAVPHSTALIMQKTWLLHEQQFLL